ncbi:MAG: ATP-dependent Clp protease adaptor ClpS [Opitutales bacterium]|nr:ATP-dependent Clp protease adaptor ClpS [Opitutales bacterium]
MMKSFVAAERPFAAMENPFEESQFSTVETLEPVWQVIVMDDPVNLMNYVVLVFETVFGYQREKATKHMLEVHEQGRSVLWVGEFEKAEAYVFSLQNWQLSAVLERVGD